MSDVVTDKLADTRKKNLEGEISLEEVTIILKNMSNNKTPGTDGLTTESLKVFWKQIGHFIGRSINFGYTQGELSVTQTQDVLHLYS